MKKQTQNKPNCRKGKKLMQSMYLQRIMKKNTAKGYEKTKPKQTQFPQSTNDNKPPLLQAYTNNHRAGRETSDSYRNQKSESRFSILDSRRVSSIEYPVSSLPCVLFPIIRH